MSGISNKNVLTQHTALLTCIMFVLLYAPTQSAQLFLEAESFSNTGGWVIDQQFMDVMGSSVLLAHGLGVPVANASATVTFPQTGTYHVYVRTRDWVVPYGPGTFRVIAGSTTLDTVFGIGGDGTWQWKYGGTVAISNVQTTIQLKDSTGFDGRCDAICFNTSQVAPPNDSTLEVYRNSNLGLPSTPPNASAATYDLVVVGGGVAGCCAAIKAARSGLKVALIQDRPVLGGNSSSEIRVNMLGEIKQTAFPMLGNIVNELDPGSGTDRTKGATFGDSLKLAKVQAEPNLSLFLNVHVYQVETQNGTIQAVIGCNTKTAARLRFAGSYFADCTGDGTIGYLAGADYLIGRETWEQYEEEHAPITAEMYHMGSTNHWNAFDAGTASTFSVCPGALQFSTPYGSTASDWSWESGYYRNPISEAEFIRDFNFRAVYGAWASEKTKSVRSTWKLEWLAFIAGKRESRRLIGDTVLTETMCKASTQQPDGIVKCTWGMDDHFPLASTSACTSPIVPVGTSTTCEPFRATFTNTGGYPLIPYRCLYSHNIGNLFMAGRDISVTRIALGTVRVQRTCGMMGEVVGAAASLCKKYTTTPRGIYQSHLNELFAFFNGTKVVPQKKVKIKIDGLQQVSIYSMSGSLLMQTNQVSFNKGFQHTLPAGIYILKVKENSGQEISRKFAVSFPSVH